MSFFQSLLLGKDPNISRKDYKYGMLRGQFAAMIISIALFYIVLDTHNQVYVFIGWYILMAIFAVFTVILNRKKYYTAASIVQLLLINSLVYIFADVDHPHGGVFFYFMTCSITGLIFFYYQSRFWSLLFALLPILLGFLAFNTDLNLIPPPAYEEHMVRINFFANFAIGILSNFFAVLFLIKQNTESERLSHESEKNLIKISADLKVSEERFAMAVKGARAGIYEWKVKDNLVYISPYWKKLLGYDENELKDFSVARYLAIVHPEDRERVMKTTQTHLKEPKPYQTELRMLTKQGEYRWFQDSGISRKDERGSITVIGLLIDIDERKAAEKELALKNIQLAKTNEELDRFVYSASHDMRAPLSSLLGLIFIAERSTDHEETKDLFERMKSRVRVMEGFIKEVTDYSRNARQEIARQEVKIKDLVTGVVDTLLYTQQQKANIQIQIPSDRVVVSDLYRLKIILNNLIQNSIKYSDPNKANKEIIISTDINESQWSITVRDNGVGISKEHLGRIFEMFYRASEHSDGSGLGLYIVKETLDKLGGTVTVESEVGKGSTFKVTFQSKAENNHRSEL